MQSSHKTILFSFLLGIGIAATITDLGIGLFSDKNYPSALTYAGVGAIAISIPILSGRRKKIEEAVEIYNSEKSSLGTTHSTFEFNALSNQNGLGFQLKF